MRVTGMENSRHAAARYRFLAGFLAAILLMSLPPAPSSAQGLSGRDLPPALSMAGRGWMAVGRLDVAATPGHPQSFCTATLIAEDRALTAAHCVVDRGTGRSLPASAMQVQLGFQNGRAEASRRVTGLQVARGVEAALRADSDGSGLALIPLDLAVLELDSPVRLPQIRPLSPAGLTGGDAMTGGLTDDLGDDSSGRLVDRMIGGRMLSVVSYARGRSQTAGLQEDCQLVTPRHDGSLVLLCDVDNGASGAPVLLMAEGGPRIVAVVSAKAELQTAEGRPMQVALAASLTSHAARDLLENATGPRHDSGVEHGARGVRIRRPGTADSGGSGARFVRP